MISNNFRRIYTTIIIKDDNAVAIITGTILSFVVLTFVVGGFIGAFYLKAEDTSRQSMTTGYNDLGNQIARDIMNSYLISQNSTNISINIKRNIPMTIGGKFYIISLNSNPGNMTNIGIVDVDNSMRTNISLNSIDNSTYVTGMIYSSAGKINITAMKNSSGQYVQIKGI